MHEMHEGHASTSLSQDGSCLESDLESTEPVEEEDLLDRALSQIRNGDTLWVAQLVTRGVLKGDRQSRLLSRHPAILEALGSAYGNSEAQKEERLVSGRALYTLAVMSGKEELDIIVSKLPYLMLLDNVRESTSEEEKSIAMNLAKCVAPYIGLELKGLEEGVLDALLAILHFGDDGKENCFAIKQMAHLVQHNKQFALLAAERRFIDRLGSLLLLEHKELASFEFKNQADRPSSASEETSDGAEEENELERVASEQEPLRDIESAVDFQFLSACLTLLHAMLTRSSTRQSVLSSQSSSIWCSGLLNLLQSFLAELTSNPDASAKKAFVEVPGDFKTLIICCLECLAEEQEIAIEILSQEQLLPLLKEAIPFRVNHYLHDDLLVSHTAQLLTLLMHHTSLHGECNDLLQWAKSLEHHLKPKTNLSLGAQALGSLFMLSIAKSKSIVKASIDGNSKRRLVETTHAYESHS